MLTDYTDQQARFDAAFVVTSTCCSITCDNCGRTYFVTSPGHGDYEDGELDELRSLAEQKPGRFIEVSDYGSVSFVRWDKKQLVVGCVCDPTKRASELIECYAKELTTYLRAYWQAKRVKAEALERKAAECEAILAVTEKGEGGR